jgi:hypothetical protein
VPGHARSGDGPEFVAEAVRERVAAVVVDATAAQARPARPGAEEEAVIRRGEEPEGWSPARGAQVGRDPEPARYPDLDGRPRRPAGGASDRLRPRRFFEVSGRV